MIQFSAETHCNRYLTAGATTVDAIVSITASGAPDGARATGFPAAAEVILLDVSGSMGGKTRKLQAAKAATATAIDCLRDGVQFGIVAGHQYATRVYPLGDDLAEANDDTREAAKRAVARLDAGGGTAIGQWLLEAERWLPEDEHVIRHAILLTDGYNQHEKPKQLLAALDRCEGRFQCDCRGVGTDWAVDELRTIGSRLLGTVDIIREPADMEADFRSMMEQSMGKATGVATLRIWTPAGARVELVSQVLPEIADISSRREETSDRIGDYPTGAWANESRDYHIRISFPARAVGDEMLAARVSLVVGDEVTTQAMVEVTWTDDLNLSTAIVGRLAHYVEQEEGVVAIRDGLTALASGDTETATERLTVAREIAIRTGNIEQVSQIERLIDPVTARLHDRLDRADMMELDTRSVKTVRIGS